MPNGSIICQNLTSTNFPKFLTDTCRKSWWLIVYAKKYSWFFMYFCPGFSCWKLIVGLQSGDANPRGFWAWGVKKCFWCHVYNCSIGSCTRKGYAHMQILTIVGSRQHISFIVFAIFCHLFLQYLVYTIYLIPNYLVIFFYYFW